MTAQMLSARPRFRGLSDWVAAVLMAVAAGGFVAAVGIEYRNGTATGNRPSASYFGLAVAIVVLPLCGGLIALRRPENGVARRPWSHTRSPRTNVVSTMPRRRFRSLSLPMRREMPRHRFLTQ